MVPILALIATLWMGTAGAAQQVELVDEIYRVPAREWRYVDFTLRQLPVTVSCSYQVTAGSAVRLLLIRMPEPRHVREYHLQAPLTETPLARSGRLDHHLRAAGRYVLAIDNRTGEGEVAVRLRAGLDFGPLVTTLSPRRRLTVILISFAVFFGIVVWSGRRLMRTLR